VQTAEGAVAEIESALIRMRELAVQASNGTLSSADQDTLQLEFAELQNSIDQVANTTDFNGIQLLNAGSGTVSLQVGADTTSNDQLSVALVDVTTGSSGLSISSLDIGSSGDASLAINTLDAALTTVSDARATFGAAQNRLEATISALSVQVESASAANSRILDVDVAAETAELTKNSILQQAAVSRINSRRPYRHANQLPYQVERAILGIKKEYPSWGAPKIREKLLRLFPDIQHPATSTVHVVLDRHGLVSRRKGRRYKAQGTELSTPGKPNQLWCCDYKGEFMLGNKKYCYPLMCPS
jgi:flagellin-like hook-associated protein FlgL